MRKHNDKPKESATSAWMVQKSMRDLTARSISVAASPAIIAAGVANPYPMLAQQNKIIDTNYAGASNISGNVPVELTNNTQSGYLQSYDYATVRLGLHYNYLAINSSDKNVAVNREYVKAMNESLSNAFAETFTDLPFFDYTITSDMPGYDDGETEHILAFTTFYQGVLQNICHIINKYNQMLALEQTMYDQSWLRETPQLRSLYGLLKKASLQAAMQGLANYVPGSALDTAWLTQMNILCNVPCKKSDSFDDPLIIVDGYTKLPNIDVSAGSGTPIFSYKNIANADAHDSSKNSYVTTLPSGITMNFEELVGSIISDLSVFTIANWARDAFSGASKIEPKEYFNTLLDKVEALISMLSRFPKDVADFDVILKVMNRVGLNNWHYGAALKIDTPGHFYKPVYNKLIYDLISAYCAGGSYMEFDTNTRRWKFYTLWDKVEDVPEYDLRSGGAFLTFSLRDLPSDTDYTTTQWLIPILFEMEADIEILNRRGFNATIKRDTVYTYTQMAADPMLARLVPLPNMTDARLRVPTIDVQEDTATTLMNASYAIKFISKLAGIGRVAWASGKEYLTMNDSLMNLIDEQLEDVSNSMINQARVSAPFRTAVASDVRTLGFVKVIQ